MKVIWIFCIWKLHNFVVLLLWRFHRAPIWQRRHRAFWKWQQEKIIICWFIQDWCEKFQKEMSIDSRNFLLERNIVKHPMKCVCFRLPTHQSNIAKESIFTHSIGCLAIPLMFITKLLLHRLEKMHQRWVNWLVELHWPLTLREGSINLTRTRSRLIWVRLVWIGLRRQDRLLQHRP